MAIRHRHIGKYKSHTARGRVVYKRRPIHKVPMSIKRANLRLARAIDLINEVVTEDEVKIRKPRAEKSGYVKIEEGLMRAMPKNIDIEDLDELGYQYLGPLNKEKEQLKKAREELKEKEKAVDEKKLFIKNLTKKRFYEIYELRKYLNDVIKAMGKDPGKINKYYSALEKVMSQENPTIKIMDSETKKAFINSEGKPLDIKIWDYNVDDDFTVHDINSVTKSDLKNILNNLNNNKNIKIAGKTISNNELAELIKDLPVPGDAITQKAKKLNPSNYQDYELVQRWKKLK